MATKISDAVEGQLISRLVDDELAVEKRNRKLDDDEFNSYMDLLDSIREPKQYEWMSDIRLPEFLSHVLTQASMDADQYFKTRDFTEVYVQDESDEALASADAAKECINRTLNQKHLYYYLKYMRAKSYNNLLGRVYARCWWEKKTKQDVIGHVKSYVPLDVDVLGRPMVDETLQHRALKEVNTPVIGEVPVVDRFNFEIIDPRNIFMDETFCYSLQDKKNIFIRSESSLDDLIDTQDDMGYFNLDKLKDFSKDLSTAGETEYSSETVNTGDVTPKQVMPQQGLSPYFDIYTRFGRFWAVVGARDESGYPLEIEPGISDSGQALDKAELVETIMTFAVRGSHKVLIRFQANPYRDADNRPYRPLLRGLCYLHPLMDSGMGDGKHVRELQLAIDDTVNISNDRVMMATLPTLITKKFDAEDNPDVYIEPGHKIPVEKPSEDIKWLTISDNIQGALNQVQLFRNMMQQVDSVFPTTMGDVPTLASTTATAVAGADNRSNMRLNYKSLTFENTFLCDMHWMILQMTWQFAHPTTGEKLMGKKVYAFNPTQDYFYKSVSQAVETESSKASKIKMITQVLNSVITVRHPDTVKMFNFLMGKVMILMGDEFANFKEKLLDEKIPIQADGGSPAGSPDALQPSNQAGVPQSDIEVAARGASNG